GVMALGPAGVEGGHLRGPGRVLAPLVEALLDLGPALREQPQHLGGDPSYIGDAVADRSPLQAEVAGEGVAEMGLVEVTGGLGLDIQGAAVERRPASVWPEGEIGHQDVGVQVGIAGPTGAVAE